MSLSQDVPARTLITGGQATAKQFAWEMAGFYRLAPWLEVGVGTLLSSLNSGVGIQLKTLGGGSRDTSKSISKTWVDPMLIVRWGSNPVKKFIYSLRAEIGGFGVGSDFAWQIQAYAGYRISRLFQVTAGYRIIGIDYNKGSGNNRFLYNMNTFGPVLRLGFNF